MSFSCFGQMLVQLLEMGFCIRSQTVMLKWVEDYFVSEWKSLSTYAMVLRD